MTRNIILFQSYKENISLLSQKQKGDLLDAIFAFNEGEEVELDAITKMAFSFIKADMNRNFEKWQETKNERSYSGRLGNIKRWNNDLYEQIIAKKITLEEAERIAKNRKESLCDNSDSLKSLAIANVANIAIDKDIDIDIDISKKEKNTKKKKFAKPTVEEVRNYCRERNNSIDAESFINFYESKGWKIGNSEMKDWKAAVRTWERRNYSSFKKAEIYDLSNKDYSTTLEGFVLE